MTIEFLIDYLRDNYAPGLPFEPDMIADAETAWQEENGS